jgi:hypothetical protein
MELTSPSLVHIIGEWIKDDPLLKRHFGAIEHLKAGSSGIIFFECNWNRPKNYTTMSDHVDRGRIVAKIVDSRVTVMFHENEYYTFQAAHPMFFPKLRGHIFDMHNRNRFSCMEHLR